MAKTIKVIKGSDDRFGAFFAETNTLISTHETLNEAMDEYAGFDFINNDERFGYLLGGMAVGLSEGGFVREQVLQAVLDSTDAVWEQSLRDLAALLVQTADQMKSGDHQKELGRQ